MAKRSRKRREWEPSRFLDMYVVYLDALYRGPRWGFFREGTPQLKSLLSSMEMAWRGMDERDREFLTRIRPHVLA